MSTDVALGITFGVASLLLVIGVACCAVGKSKGDVGFGKSLGIALISGASVAFVVLFLQIVVDDVTQAARDAAEATREEEASAEEARLREEENFKLMFSLTSDLTGFNPEALPERIKLSDLSFRGKTLAYSHMEDAPLDSFDFQDADLTGAQLEGATLTNANLVGADFKDAELEGANLTGAQLQSARFEHAAIESAESLRGAVVNARTCWPQAFLQTSQLAVGLVTADGVVSTAETADDGMFGHTCTQERTVIIRTQYPVTAEADRSSLDPEPPLPGARVDSVDWLSTPTGQNAVVTWIVED
jgi:uncharacterized protein YjbI with pentapeptide repeats